MYAVTDVGFLFQDAFDLRYRPRIGFFLRRSGIDIGESAVPLEVQPSGGGYFCFHQNPCDAGRPSAMNGKVKDLFDNPPCFRVNRKMPGLIRVFDITQRGVGSVVCAVCKPCPHGGLDLFAGLAGVHLVQDIQEWGKLAFSVEGVHIVVDRNVADAFAWEVDFCVLAGQNVVSA